MGSAVKVGLDWSALSCDAQAPHIRHAEALAALAFAFRHLKLVLEGRTALVVASGGNVDAETFGRTLNPIVAQMHVEL